MSGSTSVSGNQSRMEAMSGSLARNWWAVALRGVFGILFGLSAFVLPGVTLASLTLLFAAYMLADGVFAIVAGVRAATRHERWALLILEGVVNFAAGAAALLLPAVTVQVLVTLLGIWAVASGLVMLIAAFRLSTGHGRWLLIVPAMVSVVWGLLLYLSPGLGALVLIYWLGGYAIAFGALLLVLASRLRARRGGYPGAGQGGARLGAA